MLTDQTAIEQTLDSAATGRLFDRASARRAPVGLSVEHNGMRRGLSGELWDVTPETLVVRLESGSTRNDGIKRGVSIDGRIELDGARYVFETRLGEAPVEESADLIVLVKPTSVRKAERRHAVRRRFRKPTTVDVARQEQSAQSCRGALLNISTEGLACRVHTRDARFAQSGREVRVTFGLDDDGDAFVISGRIAGVVEARSPKFRILGIEFVSDESSRESLGRLQAVLDRPVVNINTERKP